MSQPWGQTEAWPPAVANVNRGEVPSPEPYEPSEVDSDRVRPPDLDNPNEIFMEAPKERFRLGYFDVICLVINRMIGTGIFSSPQHVMSGTHSTGASLLLWFAGSIYCLAGVHIFIEYGLNLPRYTIGGIEQSVPRSGGDPNYLQYVYRRPAYREDTVLLSVCLFGIAFIALGNMASNAISFAMRVLYAAGFSDPSEGAVRGIAICVAALTCFIHTFSRRGGIALNNLFAMVKTCILLVIIILACLVGGGQLKRTTNVFHDNTAPSKAFDYVTVDSSGHNVTEPNGSTNANSFAHAFLSIIFSFSGFDQPNYVLGEISRPKKKYPIAMTAATSFMVVMYMAVNLSYMVVVPAREQIECNGGVAQRFFDLTVGSLTGNTPPCVPQGSNRTVDHNTVASKVFNACMAISSLGNIIVMTFTAARVKQEIAKEGIIPFPKFFAQDRDMSIGRVMNYMSSRDWLPSLWRMPWLAPDDHREKTPVGAFVLHLGSCLVLIFATWGSGYTNAYTLLTSLYSYTLDAFFGALLGIGILILRLRGPPQTKGQDDASISGPAPKTWTEMTEGRINPTLSIVCAVIYTMGSLYPIITAWVKPSEGSTAGWFQVPTIAWAVLAGGGAWFLGFKAYAWRVQRKHHKVFVVEKKPEFQSADNSAILNESASPGSGGYIMVHETVYLSWLAKEALDARDTKASISEETTVEQPLPSPVHQRQSHAFGFEGGLEMNQMPPMPPMHHGHQTSQDSWNPYSGWQGR